MDNKDKAEQTQNAGAARQGGITSIEELVDSYLTHGVLGDMPNHRAQLIELAKDAASLASQSQAAQPTTTAPLKLYAFTEDGMEIDNAFGHWYKKDDVERLFAAHIAGTSQATIPEGAARSSDGTTYHNIAEIYHRFEEGESLHAVLDDKKVPRADADGKVYSLAGRVAQLVDSASQATKAQAEPTLWRWRWEDSRGMRNEWRYTETEPNVDHGAIIEVFASVAKEATRDQDEQQANVLPPFAAPAGQHDAGWRGAICGGEHDRATGTMYITVKLPKEGLPVELLTIGEAVVIAPASKPHTAGSAKGGMTNTESGSDTATTTSTVSAPTSDSAAVDCIECGGSGEMFGGFCCDECLGQGKIIVSRKDLAEGAQKAPEEVRNQWISVDERLPELHQTVALLDEKRWMNTGSSEHNVNWHGSGYLCEFGSKFWSIFGEMRSQCLDAVTHWMPLPDAPSTSSTDQANDDTEKGGA